MHLTRFTDYGLRTLIYLALRPDELASIAEIAGAYQISENHMVKVVHHLGQAGLIETIRGRNGGMRLARPAEAIGLGMVVRATEPTLALVECQEGESCAISGICRLQKIMDEVQKAMLAVLDRYNLSDIAGPNSRALRRRLGVGV
ncbi:MAG TPA: Rrf2 family transcriptional regulator [Acidocella sp.]|nr:MAG: Rrf2 family transcriptional regulator [Acidocella sp. 21-58-7]HQT64021.1 Rrf2 family transcriptional regulator [Acidocella sp.]HQU04250.1 Rrf2 family transcriptional regulator [Acidocella sp.]